jgi:trehalose 6-phosphate synthase
LARLVIVSNRVPTPRSRGAQAGGLAVVLKEAAPPGTMWFGWSGSQTARTSTEPRVATSQGVAYATIDLARDDFRKYYAGFANGTLWPLLHFRLGLMAFSRAELDGYVAVNRGFATALAPLLEPDHLVWVHDYHLIPLGAELRAQGVRNPIGFFLHVPFVPASVFGVLPCAARLLRELMAYDLIGLQTRQHVRDLGNAMAEIAGASVHDDGRVEAAGMTTRLIANPVGIDAVAFRRQAEAAIEGPESTRLLESLAGRSLIIGADRLDYSKGLPHRFQGYGRFLQRYPEHHLKVSYLQVATVSRDEVPQYRALRRELDRLAGDINGRNAEFDWVPLRYMTRPVPRATLAGFFRLARVGLVTPLRDGMNLVAKEFIAAQAEDDPGVLVLSRFAGAAETMREALLVNPHDPDEIAEAIAEALAMPLAERRRRHRVLLDAVQGVTARSYFRTFVDLLGETARRRVEPHLAQAGRRP